MFVLKRNKTTFIDPYSNSTIHQTSPQNANSFNNWSIQGKVIDGNTSDLLAGVNILEEETTNSTTTDSNGDYELQIQPVDQDSIFIKYSFTGYVTTTIAFTAHLTNINVALLRDHR